MCHFLGTFINVMIGIAVVVGFLVTFLSMYTTVIERTREIGVLKSLGASKRYIVQIISERDNAAVSAGTCGRHRPEFPDERHIAEGLALAAHPDHSKLGFCVRGLSPCWAA